MRKTLLSDIIRAVINHQLEVTPAGILVPGAWVLLSGEYYHSVNGGPVAVDKNLLTVQGLAYLLNVGLHTTSKISAWYLALFGGAATPLTTWTAATFPAGASELSSGTEGYSEVNRPLWNGTTTTTGQIDNLTGGEATFTIVTAGTLSVTGAALLSDQGKGSTSGVLMSASKFSVARTLFNGDTFDLGYRVSITST